MGCSRMSFIKLSVNVTNACELVFGLQIDFDPHTLPFNGHFFGTTRVSRYQKDKTKRIQSQSMINSHKQYLSSVK